VIVILQIVFVFAQAIGFLGFVGTLFQSFSEAQAAATTVFPLIDEVNWSYLRSYIVYFHNTG
jgi:hypothetical protein